MARSDGDPLARLHALWTLEGLDAVTGPVLATALADGDRRVRSAAVRIAEPRLAVGDPAGAAAVAALADDVDPGVATQVCLSLLSTLKPGDADQQAMVDGVVSIATDRHDHAAAVVSRWRENQAKAAADAKHQAEMALADKAKGELYARGRDLYGQTCIACHGGDGNGMPTPERDGRTIAPPLRGSHKLLADRQLVARILLHGLTGPNNGTTYPGQMASFDWADDGYLAAILTYARNDWGNSAPSIKPEDVAAVRQGSAGRRGPFTVLELYAAAQGATPVTADGARVEPAAGEVVLDPTTATVHGDGWRVDCTATGFAVSGGGAGAASWTAHLSAGDWGVAVRASADFDERVAVRVADHPMGGGVRRAVRPGTFADVPVGAVHLDHDGDVAVELRSDDSRGIHLSAVRFDRR